MIFKSHPSLGLGPGAARHTRLHAGAHRSAQPRCRTVQTHVAEETVQARTGKPTAPANQQQTALAALASLQANPADGADAGLAAVTRDVLMSDPETAEQLKRYEAAMARVEAMKAAAVELEEIFKQANKDVALSEAQQQANTKLKAEQLMANAEVQAAEKLLEAAQWEATRAKEMQAKLAEEVKQNLERVESVKAGVLAAAGGAVASLPLLLVSGTEGVSAALTLGTTLGSCFLFGVVYRYAVRLDSTNTHLRSGAVGAFGLVRAAAAGDVLQSGSALGPFDIETVVGPAALYTGQSMMLFAFAAAAVELAFERGLVRRFGAPVQE